MGEKRKLARWVDGTVFAIPLGDGTQVFGRMLKRPLMALYDWRTRDLPPLEEILSRPVLFKVWAHHDPVLYGQWPLVGRQKLEPEMKVEPSFYKQDSLNGRLSSTGRARSGPPRARR